MGLLNVDRYTLEREGGLFVIRDTATGELVQHQTLEVPERYRSEGRALRRIRQLEEENQRAHGEG